MGTTNSKKLLSSGRRLIHYDLVVMVVVAHGLMHMGATIKLAAAALVVEPKTSPRA